MLFHITKESLLTAIQHVIKSVPSGNPVPILTGIHIQACSDALILTAGDARLTISYHIPIDEDIAVRIERPGDMVVPAKYLYEILRKLDSGSIEIERSEQLTVKITSGQSHFRLSSMDPSEYPIMPGVERNSSLQISMPCVEFITAVKQVVIATSTSEARPVLTGVLFEIQKNSLHLMATDGIQFASCSLNLESDVLEPLRVIVPGQVLNEI